MPGNRARPLGGGPSEKDQHHWHLVGGLPYLTPGSARARRVRLPPATRQHPQPARHGPAPAAAGMTCPLLGRCKPLRGSQVKPVVHSSLETAD